METFNPISCLFPFAQQFFPDISIHMSFDDGSPSHSATEIDIYLREYETSKRTRISTLQNMRLFQLSEVAFNYNAIQSAMLSGISVQNQQKWLSCFIQSLQHLDRRITPVTKAALLRQTTQATLVQSECYVAELKDWSLHKDKWSRHQGAKRLSLLQHMWKFYSLIETKYPMVDSSIQTLDDYHTRLDIMDEDRKHQRDGRYITALVSDSDISNSDNDAPPAPITPIRKKPEVALITRVTSNKLKLRGHLESFTGNQLKDHKNATQFMIEFDRLADHWLEDTSYQSMLNAFSQYVTEEPAKSKFKAYCNDCNTWKEFKERFVKSLPPYLSEAMYKEAVRTHRISPECRPSF
eukprot:gene46386-62039_t